MKQQAQGFGERFAWGQASGLSGLVLFLCVTSLVRSSALSFYTVVLVLLLSHWFRRRFMREEQRRNEVMEDERDAVILARSELAFRRFASCWFVILALVLSTDATRRGIPAHTLAVPSLLLLGVLGANIAGHLATALAYRRDRLAQ